MMKRVKFTPQHLSQMKLQKAQEAFWTYTKPEHVERLVEDKYSFAILADDGRPVLCAGVIEYWPGRAEAWALFDANCRQEFVGLFNETRKFLAECPIRRIETVIKCGWPEGTRWARALGLTLEAARMEAYMPDGSDASLYVRVKHG